MVIPSSLERWIQALAAASWQRVEQTISQSLFSMGLRDNPSRRNRHVVDWPKAGFYSTFALD